jgi:hypothetical protein
MNGKVLQLVLVVAGSLYSQRLTLGLSSFLSRLGEGSQLAPGYFAWFVEVPSCASPHFSLA